MTNIAHPDTIPGLDANVRRELRTEYQAIQIASDPERLVLDDAERWVAAPNMADGGYWSHDTSPRRRTGAEISRDVAAACLEYRRVAGLWGVDV